jgi:uncharacterized protein (DUF58 family)
MTRGGALLLGIAVTVTALAFGSRPLGVAGVGLLIAAVAAKMWSGLARGQMSVSFAPEPSPALEGRRVRVRIDARRSSPVPVGSAVVRGTLGRLGEFECRLSGHRRRLAGELDFGRVARGRFVLSDAQLVLGDYLGLESFSRPLESGGVAVVVHPRLAELETLFSEAGRLGASGRRLLLRRPAGFDLHSVREYTQGESLRRVHWPTTARTGQLMVKELEDSPRDSVAVLLDCDSGGVAGDPADSSFDAAVRAAGSVLRFHVAHGRRSTLVTTGREGVVQPISRIDGDFALALDALAAAEPDAPHGLASWLGELRRKTSEASELVVVTANLEPSALEALLNAATRRVVSVVWIDAASYAGRPTRAATGPLRLSAAGLPVAVVRRGDDLGSALDLSRVEARAHG